MNATSPSTERMSDTPTERLQRALDQLHPSARWVRVEAIDLEAALARSTPAFTESELRAAADGVDAAWHDEGDHIEYHPELAERLMALRAALARLGPEHE